MTTTARNPLSYCHVEILEPRIAPATFVVNSVADVDNSDPNTYIGTLRWAINETNINGPGKDTIVFDQAVFVEGATIVLTEGQLPAITGDLVIKGLGADRVIVDGFGTNNRMFVMDDGDPDVIRTVSISGITITNAGNTATTGGAIFSAESLNISNSIISGNMATAGAGIFFSSDGNLSIRDSVIADNKANYFGGGIHAAGQGKFEITNSLVSGNTASGGGGGYFGVNGTKGSLHINNSSFVSNEAEGNYGGGLRVSMAGDKSSVSINNSEFTHNEALLDGGGIHIQSGVFNSPTKIQLNNVAVANNLAGDGGGIAIVGTPEVQLSIKSGDIHNNTAQGQYPNGAMGTGGGIQLLNVGNAKVVNTAFSGNSANGTYIPLMGGYYVGGNGGGIFAFNSNLETKGASFSGNQSYFNGGAIYANLGTTSVVSSLFLGNIAGPGAFAGMGGAVAGFDTDLSIAKSHFEGNSAADRGGAVALQAGSLDISKSDFISNRAGGHGGAISAETTGANVQIAKSTISGNQALAAGGGIQLQLIDDDSTAQIVSSTISGNTAIVGGGIHAALLDAGAQLDISKTDIVNNATSNLGAGAYLNGKGTVTIDRSDISANAALSYGGGISTYMTNGGVLEMSKSTVTDNVGFNGGGILNLSADPIQLSKTTISGNFAFNDPTLAKANLFGPESGYVAPQFKAMKGTFVVDDLGDAGPGTLRQAIEDANASGKNATIVFDPSIGKGTIQLAGPLPTVTGNLTIKGPGADFVSISGENTHQIFNFDNGDSSAAKINIEGLALTKGFADNGEGGAIYNANETLKVSNVIFVNNKADFRGGALYIDAGSFHIQNSLFLNNQSGDEGGAIAARSDGGSGKLQNVMAVANQASFSGGGIWLVGSDNSGTKFSVNNLTALGNQTDSSGGGLYVGIESTSLKSSVTVTNSILGDNTAANSGGGFELRINSDGSKAKIDNVIIANNQVTEPGALGGGLSAILAESGKFILSNSSISGNTSEFAAGGLYLATPSNVQVKQTTFAGNESSAGSGGAIVAGSFNDAVISIVKSDIAGNKASLFGGGLFGAGSQTQLSLNGVTLAGNTASIQNGGGIHFEEGLLQMKNTTLTGNTATSGGGLSADNGASLDIKSSTFIGNSGLLGAGGLFQQNTGDLTRIHNSVFAANHGGFATGGLLVNQDNGAADLRSLTVVGNASTIIGGAGVFADGPGSAEITALAVIRNAASNNGGGMYLGGDTVITMSKSTISTNHSGNVGGGVFLGDSATLDLQRSTISNNLAQADGGGIFNNTGDPNNIILTKSSVSGNFAPGNPNIG